MGNKKSKGIKYTHRDGDGLLWRFEDMRPVSILADIPMVEFTGKISKTRADRLARWTRFQAERLRKAV